MIICETCHGHDRPEALIAAAMAEARALAAEIAAVETLIEPKLRGVARTVRSMAESRRIADPMFEGPLSALVERLDRSIADATTTVVRTVERGYGVDGPIYDEEPETIIDAAAAPFVPLRNKARTVAALLDRARDVAAADAAVASLRDRVQRP
jgi:hypothetical protein